MLRHRLSVCVCYASVQCLLRTPRSHSAPLQSNIFCLGGFLCIENVVSDFMAYSTVMRL